ncbi:MAG: D-alanyl-D-alanine carboxypeptidase [Gammaproteobacteria bacterium]|nr:D-alanyl-D-alanine carboxypeptidase [Gammaproteobacteria bacterium]
MRLRNALSYTFGLLVLLFASASHAAPLIPNAPDLDATSYILVDFNTGAILAEKNSAMQAEPASITKLMTVYVAFQELRNGTLKLDDKVTVSKKAWRTEGSRMFIEVGKQVKVEDLMQGIIVQSGNDASIALAEHIAGTEETFAQLMNQHAQTLGMTQTNFLNATGLPDDGHLTTAADIATLASAIIREFPEYYNWYSQLEFTYAGIRQFNRNKLLRRDRSVDGLKTGHTESAGYCLAASAKRDNMRLVSVVLGTDSDNARSSATQALLNYGFRFFETHELFTQKQVIESPRIWGGAKQTLAVGTGDALSATIPRGQSKSLTVTTLYNEQLQAPIEAGTAIGEVQVTLQDKLVSRVPLLALETVPEGTLFQRLKDKVLLMFEGGDE